MVRPSAQPWLAILALAGSAAFGPACLKASPIRPGPAPPAAPSTTSQPNPWADSVRNLLAPQCGSCHMPDLPTSKPGALVVFNLVDEPWYARMSAEQLEALAQRVRGNEAFAELERLQVEAFVRCATGGTCDQSPDECRPPLDGDSAGGQPPGFKS